MLGMTGDQDSTPSVPRGNVRFGWSQLPIAIISVTVLVIGAFLLTHHTSPYQSASTTTRPPLIYPIGVPDDAEPSGYAPPKVTAMPGFHQSYVTDFTGNTIPAGWNIFTGIPGGDPGAHFGAGHVSVANGQLQLLTFRDAGFQNEWVAGGICSCGHPQLYGAFFVRSRVSGNGPNEVELLWPESDHWPPEIDFNETPTVKETSATVHWSEANRIQQWYVAVDLRKWNTWGVIWTPDQIILTVNGRKWGETTSGYQIPQVPMRVDLEQRTKCSQHVECPTVPTQMQVDWVAEYAIN